ncbi:MAG TPA: DinB family protein [Thermoanaerobaculia bacterium]|nr:DinB family protein [Thermoanaerobaculia bacterium]
MSSVANRETGIPTALQHLLASFEREQATTMRILKALPREKSELRPHPMCKTARELAWMFVLEQGAMEKGLTSGFDWSKPPAFPPPPEAYGEVLTTFEKGNVRVMELLRRLTDADLTRPVKFFTGPGKIADIPMYEFLWLMLKDQVHHRGQFSIYLRMADAKVPSIYGPTADERW